MNFSLIIFVLWSFSSIGSFFEVISMQIMCSAILKTLFYCNSRLLPCGNMENSTGLVILPNGQPTWFSLSHAALFLVVVLFCLSGCVGGGKEFHFVGNTFSDRQCMLLFLCEISYEVSFHKLGSSATSLLWKEVCLLACHISSGNFICLEVEVRGDSVYILVSVR